MLKITPLHALKDNYIWTIHRPVSSQIAVVDPGEAAPVISYLSENKKTLHAILITHHHQDHTGGISELCRHFPHTLVFGPRRESIPHCTHPLEGGETISLFDNKVNFQILAIPGHTKGHIAYYGHGALFCGDTLFSCGCGRNFEGSTEQLYASLQDLNKLSPETLIYCGHEYTLANLAFAKHVEPDNPAIVAREQEVQQLRAKKEPSLPVSLATEQATNPFLRCHISTIQHFVRDQYKHMPSSESETFKYLRQWKDRFVPPPSWF